MNAKEKMEGQELVLVHHVVEIYLDAGVRASGKVFLSFKQTSTGRKSTNTSIPCPLL